VFDFKDQYVISLWDGKIYPGQRSYASKIGKTGQVITCEVDMTLGAIRWRKDNELFEDYEASLLKSGEWWPTFYIRADDAKLSIVSEVVSKPTPVSKPVAKPAPVVTPKPAPVAKPEPVAKPAPVQPQEEEKNQDDQYTMEGEEGEGEAQDEEDCEMPMF